MDSKEFVSYYTGIGSRNTPPDIGVIMRNIASKLYKDGFMLRSGGANGADTFFEEGVWSNIPTAMAGSAGYCSEIYIPWDNFNKRNEESGYIIPSTFSNFHEALEIAESVHPCWTKCSQGAKLLHARNVYQVLGADLKTPSDFLICWAEEDINGNIKGGTRTAVELAHRNKIPVYNMYRFDHLEWINNLVFKGSIY